MTKKLIVTQSPAEDTRKVPLESYLIFPPSGGDRGSKMKSETKSEVRICFSSDAVYHGIIDIIISIEVLYSICYCIAEI